MSITALAAKSRLSDRATRSAVKELERLGELSVTPRRGGIGHYKMSTTPADSAGLTTMDDRSTPADSAGPPRQIVPDHPGPTPAESAGPADSPSGKPQVSGTPAESAGPPTSDALDLSSVVSGGKSKSKSREESQPPRDDVERLCTHLADRIEANGSKRPHIDKRWRDAARRMIDIDDRDEEKAHALIDWCQQDYFWRQNIHSMPTFRRQYDKLRLAAIAEWEKKKHRGLQPGASGHPRQVSYSDEEYTRGWQ